MKVLIVEDQAPIIFLEDAVKKVLPKYFPGFTKQDYDVAKWYTQAKELVEKNNYDLIFLDHRMPYEKPEVTEDEDFHKFSASLQDIGYGLIPIMRERNPNTVIIGTSSLSGHELEYYSAPDYKINKVFDDVSAKLDEIVKEDFQKLSN